MKLKVKASFFKNKIVIYKNKSHFEMLMSSTYNFMRNLKEKTSLK